MRYLSIAEVLDLDEWLLVASGGATGVRDLGALESAVSQPHASFDGQDLYPDGQEQVILQLAAGELPRNAFTDWVRLHTTGAAGTGPARP